MVTAIANNTRVESHIDYDNMLAALRANFVEITGPVFTTDVSGEDLWGVYLNDMPAHERQHHNCHTCRRFIQQYGGLVTIDAEGRTRSALVSELMRLCIGGLGMFTDPLGAVAAEAEREKVTGVFLASERYLGEQYTFDKKRSHRWYHMHVEQPEARRYKGTVLTAAQKMAELGEDYGTLCRALAEFKPETVIQALAIAKAESLYRGEKVEGRIQWLVDLNEKRRAFRNRSRSTEDYRKDNVTWLAVATAPAGFCHVRSSVVGSLLEDIEAGKPFAEVKRAFDAKMHPLQYQRPTAPPSDGNLKQAETIVEKLGSAGALRRRYARLEDLQTIWTPAPPRPAKPPLGGVFGHLRNQPPASAPMVAKGTTMTWEKFARTVLPTAEKIEAFAPAHGNYHAFVTAADLDAPPILQWDREDVRNPVSWYTHSGGSPSRQWNLGEGGFVDVTAISPMPNQWQPGFDHHGKGVLLVLKDCRDKRNASLCLFPELLKNEYHSIRRSIEAYSASRQIEEADGASACGLTIRNGMTGSQQRLRVHSSGAILEYTIDRWD